MSIDDQVYLRCYICDYSGSSEESLLYLQENEKGISKRSRKSRVVRVDPRDGKPVCSKCDRSIVDINYEFNKHQREKVQLESWADQLLKEAENFNVDEILKGLDEE